MKTLMTSFLFLIPALSMASYYTCSGDGFNIEVVNNPLEMKVIGNGFDSKITNLNSITTFDTTISGNTSNPAATLKLIIKDSSFANPGDSFKATLNVTSGSGMKEYSRLICLRGND